MPSASTRSLANTESPTATGSKGRVFRAGGSLAGGDGSGAAGPGVLTGGVAPPVTEGTGSLRAQDSRSDSADSHRETIERIANVNTAQPCPDPPDFIHFTD